MAEQNPMFSLVLKVAKYFGVTTDALIQDAIELDTGGESG
jgi:hypothetical protein